MVGLPASHMLQLTGMRRLEPEARLHTDVLESIIPPRYVSGEMKRALNIGSSAERRPVHPSRNMPEIHLPTMHLQNVPVACCAVFRCPVVSTVGGT